MKLPKIKLLLFVFLSSTSSWSQLDYLVNSYKPTEYHSAPQVLSIAQDSNSIFYLGLKTGVLVFDGVRWEVLEVGDEQAVWSLKEERGRIYVGSDRDFGFLEQVDTLAAVFKSLAPDSSVGRVERIFFDTKGKGYFQSSNQVYTYFDGKTESLNCVSDADEIFFCFLVEDTLYVQLKELGLQKLIGNKLEPIYTGLGLARNKILAHTQYNGKHLLAVDGVGLLTGKKLDQLSPVNSLNFNTNLIHALTPSGGNLLAVGTIGEGVYLLDANLNFVKNINANSGLNDQVVNTQFCGADGNLWVGGNYGFNSILVNTSVTAILLKDHGLSSIEDILEYQNNLYLATQSGVYKMTQHAGRVSFVKIPVTDNDTYGLLNFDSGLGKLLMIAANDAIYSWDGEAVRRYADCGPYGLIADVMDTNRLIIGNYNGLSAIRWNGTSFIDEGYIKGVDLDIPSMAYDKNGWLYIGTENEGLHQCIPIAEKMELIAQPEFKNNHVVVRNINDSLYVGTENGLYRQYATGWEKLALSAEVCSFEEYGVHRVFQFSNDLVGLALYNGFDFELGCWSFDGTIHPLNHDLKLYRSLPHAGFADDKGKFWLGGNDRLICVDTDFEHHLLMPRKTFVRSYAKNGKNQVNLSRTDVQFKYSSSTYTFYFYQNDFSNPKENQYSYKLIGQDDTWSPWSTQPFASYTNLIEGNYELMVRGKTALGEPAIGSSFHFEILPPWYRTWLAFVGYFILFVCSVWALVRIQTRRLKVRQKELEEEVSKATLEIREQKDEIEILFEEVTDSIKYAKNIQNSILPSTNLITAAFPQHFVLYEPKDIVSGDFYWSAIKCDKSYIAAVDCTGHGVPGAFMSMLGASGLNNAVNSKNLEKPGEILDALSSYAYANLNKDRAENTLNDGMDVSLISIDTSSKTLEYAGAFNPAVVVRKEEIILLKGERKSVGNDSDLGMFRTQSFALEEGDMIYLFSDGYQDQFGGERGKKFMSKSLKQLFVRIAHMDMNKQYTVLKDSFEKWKGELEQIDDVLVIGISFKQQT